MSTVTLKDQIGAMTIVDQIRLDESRLQDYLNAPLQRKKLIEKLRSHYFASGQSVSDSVLAEGVREWFKDRLTYIDIPLPWYFSLFITRARWLPRLKIICIGFVLMSLAVYSAMSLTKSITLENAKEQWSSLYTDFQNTVASTDRLDVSDLTNVEYPYVQTSVESIALTREKLESNLPLIQDQFDRTKTDLDDGVIPDLAQLDTVVRNNSLMVSEQIRLRESAVAFTVLGDVFYELLKQDSTAIYRNQFPAVDTAINNIRNIVAISTTTTAELEAAVADLKNKLNTSARLVELKASAFITKEETLRTLLHESDKNLVRQVYSSIETSIQKFDLPPDNTITLLNSYHSLALTSLSLIINPNNTGKTGVERTFNPSSGKAWYVVCQGIDESGKPHKLSIRNVETGKISFVDTFAVRVEKSLFDAIRADKSDDGIVNNSLLGTKPVGTLAFTLSEGVTNQFITEW